MEKFTLQKRLIFASGFYVCSLSKCRFQKFHRVILFTDSANQLDELALRRSEGILAVEMEAAALYSSNL